MNQVSVDHTGLKYRVAGEEQKDAAWGPHGACSMEPGGFEPPCRNGAEAASTCVVTTLFSVRREAGDNPSQDHGIQVSRSAEVCQPIGTSLIVIPLVTSSGVG